MPCWVKLTARPSTSGTKRTFGFFWRMSTRLLNLSSTAHFSSVPILQGGRALSAQKAGEREILETKSFSNPKGPSTPDIPFFRLTSMERPSGCSTATTWTRFLPAPRTSFLRAFPFESTTSKYSAKTSGSTSALNLSSISIRSLFLPSF